MQNAHDPLANLRIATPCPASWESMTGDERARHCTLCNLNVYNFAEMTRDEVREFLMRTEGRVCARIYQRADGTLITRDCPTGLRALRRRAARIAAAVFTTLLALPSFVFAKSRLKTEGAKVQLQTERVATRETAMFHGAVLDPSGAPIPGVSVILRSEDSAQTIPMCTDVNGAFNLASLHDGLYRVEVAFPGFEPATIEHLRLKAGKATNVNVILQPQWVSVTIGIVAMNPPTVSIDPMSTTYSQDFINKLPL